MPLLGANPPVTLQVPPPPGWTLLRADLRKAYVAELAKHNVRVPWPTK
jgi:hypothetical protein